jgi:hypothetical protein
MPKEHPPEDREDLMLNDDSEGEDEEFIEESSVSHRVFDYINTKKGDLMLGRFVKILEEIAPAAKEYLVAKVEIQKGHDFWLSPPR